MFSSSRGILPPPHVNCAYRRVTHRDKKKSKVKIEKTIAITQRLAFAAAEFYWRAIKNMC